MNHDESEVLNERKGRSTYLVRHSYGRGYLLLFAWTSLAVVGLYMRQQGIWKVIEDTGKIEKIVHEHGPSDKLLHCLINSLAGGAVVEINTRACPDRGLDAAFGRRDCAEPSGVSSTLNACSEETVMQMRSALTTVYRQRSLGYEHDYTVHYQRTARWSDREIVATMGTMCRPRSSFAKTGGKYQQYPLAQQHEILSHSREDFQLKHYNKHYDDPNGLRHHPFTLSTRCYPACA